MSRDDGLGSAADVVRELRRLAWQGRHAGDSLYGLNPLPDELGLRLLVLAAQIEANAPTPAGVCEEER